MKKKVFVDFGSGSNLKAAAEAKKKGMYVILVNKNEKYLYKPIDGKEVDSDYLDMVSDELYFFDVADLSQGLKLKADEWNCSAVLEHVRIGDIDNFLLNICRNVKDDSIGHIGIDLSDHWGGFNHYEFPLKGRYSSIKNTLKVEDWIPILTTYFDASFEVNPRNAKIFACYDLPDKSYPSQLYFKDVIKNENFRS